MEDYLSGHKEFNGKINSDTYNLLELLCKVGYGQEISDDVSFLNTFKTLEIAIDGSIKNKMKGSIYYIRLCKIIESLLKEYKDYDEDFRKYIIDYYIQSNVIKEMNNVGFGWYYNMKFKKYTATLYSVGYGEESNWHKWIKNRYDEFNQLKENGIQLIFHACKEHINRGGKIRLKSLSKCFGIDMFKYMQLDKNGIANLFVIKDTHVNFIEYEGTRISLQEYLLLSNKYSTFDMDKKPNFCLDISQPRNNELKNYNNWSKDFLTDYFISKAEFEKTKERVGMESNIYNNFILNCLINEHKAGGDSGISSRISPIADKEVVVSDTLWEIEKYIEEGNINTLPEKCYHITFDESEYYYLIFSYFKTYYIEKYNGQESFEERYKNQLEMTKREIERSINELENENAEYLLKEELENKKISENERLIEFYKSYKVSIEAINIDDESAKAKFALSFVDWKMEDIPKNWSLDNMYIKENTEKNLKLNCYKCFCKRVALS